MKQSTKYLKILVNLMVALVTILCLCFLLPKFLVFFMPFVIGWIISMIANPLVRFLEKRVKIVRKHGSMMIIIGVLAAVIGLGYLGISRLVTEAGHLITNLPQMYANLQEDFEEIGENLEVFYHRLPKDTQENLEEAGTELTGYLGGLVQAIGEPTFDAAGNFVKNVPGTLVAIIMSLLSAYFFTAERDAILAELKKAAPSGVYVLLVIGLFILKVDFVLLVAFLIAFLDMLPFFGTGTVLWPWAAIKILSGDYQIAIGLMILYAVTQIVRQVIQPKIVGDTIGMNPLATLIFMYIGYKVSSIAGMIIAVPLGMILINLYQAGVFENQIRCVRELVNDINEFRKF